MTLEPNLNQTRDRQCTCKRLQVRSHNYCCRGETISITHSECVSVTLVIQHTNRMRRTILSPVSFQDLKYFSTLSHKRQEFRVGGGGGVIEQRV
jgi:hypothetical protein